MQEFLLQPRGATSEIRIVRGASLRPEFRKGELGEFSRAAQVFGVMFVVNGQLFAGMNAVARIGGDFQPDLGGARVFAAALGHQRQLAARHRAEFGGQPNLQSLRARGVRAIVLPAALEKSR